MIDYAPNWLCVDNIIQLIPCSSTVVILLVVQKRSNVWPQTLNYIIYLSPILRPCFSIATVTFYDIKCHSFLMSFVSNWGPFSPNGVFYWSDTATILRFYTSWNLYFIKQDHQIATIDIREVWFSGTDVVWPKHSLLSLDGIDGTSGHHAGHPRR
jgi:hypothetical protein